LFLQSRLKKLAKLFGACILMLIFAGLGTGALSIRSSVWPLQLLLAVAVTFGLFVGVVGVPASAVMWIVNSRRLKDLERSGLVPAKRIDKSFIGEGQRIIKALLPGSGGQSAKVWGEFSVPEHKALDQIDATPEEKKKLRHPTPEGNIVAVGKTINEVEKDLPPQWKSLWERRNNCQPNKGETQ
jgi:hypothetical protein